MSVTKIFLKISFVITLFAFASMVHSETLNAKQLSICNEISLFAEVIMDTRLDGITEKSAIAALGPGDGQRDTVYTVYQEVILEAYASPLITWGDSPDKMIANFRDQTYVNCAKAIINKDKQALK